MKFLVPALLLALPAMAQANCLNFAKYFAIKAYFEEVGVVQGSNGVSYSAELLKEQAEVETYAVAISDNNEDGDLWTFNYEVETKQIEGSDKCSLVGLKKISEE